MKDPRSGIHDWSACRARLKTAYGPRACARLCAPPKLKFWAASADIAPMFHVRSEPLLLSEAGIYGLCVSLNAPVLNIQELPVGPARAAIVLFDSGYGSTGLGIGVRSLESRQVIVFSFRGTLDMQLTSVEAMESAMSFAERMGFLFDEDVVATGSSDGRARALCLWTDLTGVSEPQEDDEPEEIALPPLSPAVRLEPEPEELVLDEVATAQIAAQEDLEPPAGELWLDALSEVAPAPAERRAGSARPDSPRPLLSKFRQPARVFSGVCAAPEGNSDESSSRSAVGRIVSARRRSDGGEQPQKPGLFLRLLGSF